MARILIAEDDDSMRHFLTMALARAGHETESCGDGLAALAALAAPPGFDLLLADIIMPGMDGIELSRKAAARHPALKIMFITGFAAIAANTMETLAAKDPADALTAPPTPVLSKPFHLKELVEQVERILAS